MKRLLAILVMALVTAALAMAGCKKEEASKEPTKEPVATKPAEPAKPAEPVKPVEPPKPVEPAASADTSGAPEYMKKSIEYSMQISKLLKENMGDCSKAVDLVAKYVEEHRADIDAISKASAEATAKMTDEEKIKMAQQMMTLMGPGIREMSETMAAFAQKCPPELQKLNQSMAKFKMK